MLSEIKIEGFRCFKDFSAKPLKNVNLIIGANNSGKTCFLEAAQLLSVGVSPFPMLTQMERRKEFSDSYYGNREGFPFEYSNLFWGRVSQAGSSFTLRDNNRKYACSISLIQDMEKFRSLVPDEYIGDEQFLSEPVPFMLNIKGDDDEIGFALNRRFKSFVFNDYVDNASVFIGTDRFSTMQLSLIWDKIVLKEEEKLVYRYLKLIEPDIERIAFINSKNPTPKVKLENREDRIPLGSMGEGIHRLLELALGAATTPKGGVLLIDEIDTGLHYSVIKSVWKFLFELSQQYGFQIFTTTHSLDCLMSLSSLIKENESYANSIAIHRIDKDASSSTYYSAEELSIAIDQELEIR